MLDGGLKKMKHEKTSVCVPRPLEAPRQKKSIIDNMSLEPASVTDELFWPKGLTPFDFQLKAVDFALDRLEKFFSVYLGLDPGLGKTICACIIANKLRKQKPTRVYYVCPPFLTTNTLNEFSKWCFETNLFLIPDSTIWKPDRIEALEQDLSRCNENTILFIDEAHRFKNETSKRTKALMTKILPLFKKVVWMSGTPLPNSRPIELWPVLKYGAPEVFGKNFFDYAMKYCGAFQTPFGWDFSGFTNRKEWKARITRTFMLRMRKDVLDLPPKIEGLLTVGEDMPPAVSKIEKRILEKYTPEDLIQGKIQALAGGDSLHLATYLRLLGEYKLKYVLPAIEQILEETKENIIIFAVHKETIKKLQSALAEYDPLVITGDVPKEKRQGIVKKFQESKAHRVFIGNINACGVGFTLTKATRVLFVEFLWVDGDNSQASDRAHRIGQTGTVLVQYVVLKDSIDAKRMGVLLNKRSKAI